ncbi:lecithin retinol acyltransferase family protein [Psychrobacter piscatorii]|uniref:lecithin retinol acyltransferase family protein n=1 Tax=Psychrobacter TaxID=497 RepID=UPI003734D56E
MKKLTAGSHIKTYRLGYSHHGIYCGDGRVVHYSGFAQAFKKGALEVTTLERFLGGEIDYYIVQHPSHKLKYSSSEIVERALSRVGEDSYNLAFNNCEHFATWCVTGRGESKQVRSALTYTTTAAAAGYHATRTASTAAQVTGLVASSAKALSGTTTSGIAVGRLAGCATGAIGGAALGTSGAVGTTALVGATGAVSGTTALGFMATGAATAAAAPIALPALAVVGAGAVIGGILGGFFD